jgi:hypothetical protein
MLEQELLTPAALAIFTLAEIKGATLAFDSGQANLSDTLDAIAVALAAYHQAADRRRDAA